MFIPHVLGHLMIIISHREAPHERNTLTAFKHAANPQKHDAPALQKMASELADVLCPGSYGCRCSSQLQKGAASLQRFLFPVINRKMLDSLEFCGNWCDTVSIRI